MSVHCKQTTDSVHLCDTVRARTCIFPRQVSLNRFLHNIVISTKLKFEVLLQNITYLFVMPYFVCPSKAVVLRKFKGAQCSEPVKSGVPSMWFLGKNKDFLVAAEQKLGTRSHWALVKHSPPSVQKFFYI